MTTLKKPVRRVTNSALDGCYGPDRDRRIVVTLIPGNGKDVKDLFELRPEGTRRPERIAIQDVYAHAMRCRINAVHMAKLREKKAKKAERLARQRVQRADKRMVEAARAELGGAS